MSTTIDAQKTIAELVVDRPNLMRVFERMGIDYCCGGKKPLADACAERGLDVDTVVQTLDAFEGLQEVREGQEDTDWSQASMTDLCNHIEKTHHQYLRTELPRIQALVDKVTQVHGERHPYLSELQPTFLGMQQELMAHMQKEERILFPAIRQLENDEAGFGFGSVTGPIQVMESEHDSAGNALEILNRLTDGYTPPADACRSYRAMLDGLRELEKDLHQHIHKENNILFPRAIAREQQLMN